MSACDAGLLANSRLPSLEERAGVSASGLMMVKLLAAVSSSASSFTRLVLWLVAALGAAGTTSFRAAVVVFFNGLSFAPVSDVDAVFSVGAEAVESGEAMSATTCLSMTGNIQADIRPAKKPTAQPESRSATAPAMRSRRAWSSPGCQVNSPLYGTS